MKIVEDWNAGQTVVALGVVVAVLVAHHYKPDAALLSGFMGSIIGALATVFSTTAIMKHTAAKAKEQLEAAKEDEYRSSLRALKAEVEYNYQILCDPADYYVNFSTTAWNRFWGHLHRLDAVTSKLLGDGYMNVDGYGTARMLILEKAQTTTRLAVYGGKIKSAFNAVLQSKKLDG